MKRPAAQVRGLTGGVGGIWPAASDFQLWMGGEEKDFRFQIRSFDSPAARSG